MSELSEYEKSRAEQIRRNNAYLVSLGIIDIAKEMKPKPKPKAPPKPKEEPTGPSRRSSRLDGLPAEEFELGDGSSEQPAFEGYAADTSGRDCYCCWWTVSEECPEGVTRPPLTELQRRALTEPLGAEDRDSLVIDGEDEAWVTVRDAIELCPRSPDPEPILRSPSTFCALLLSCLQDMLKFSRAYGGKSPEPFCVPSRANFKKFLDTVSVLASGDGVTCAYRGGAFDAGVKYTPKHDLDEALGRALKWLPKAKDKSNGWTFTHPFEKMKQYQRALFWRHLFPFVWPEVLPTPHAEAKARAKAGASGANEAAVWLRMAGLEAEAAAAEEAAEAAGTGGEETEVRAADAKAPKAAKATTKAAKAKASATKAKAEAPEEEEEEEEEEDAPLAKRRKKSSAARAARKAAEEAEEEAAPAAEPATAMEDTAVPAPAAEEAVAMAVEAAARAPAPAMTEPATTVPTAVEKAAPAPVETTAPSVEAKSRSLGGGGSLSGGGSMSGEAAGKQQASKGTPKTAGLKANPKQASLLGFFTRPAATSS